MRQQHDEYDDDRDIMEMRDEPDELERTEGLEIYDDAEIFFSEEDLSEMRNSSEN